MSEAPEVIWAVTEPNDVSADILGDVYAQQLPDGMNGTPVKYVRADRIEELEAKLEKAVDALVEAVIVPEAWMISGFPDMPSEAKEQIVASVIKTRTTIKELKGGKDE